MRRGASESGVWWFSTGTERRAGSVDAAQEDGSRLWRCGRGSSCDAPRVEQTMVEWPSTGVNVRPWVAGVSRFLESGVDGLLDEPRPGAPRQISDSRWRRWSH